MSKKIKKKHLRRYTDGQWNMWNDRVMSITKKIKTAELTTHERYELEINQWYAQGHKKAMEYLQEFFLPDK